MMSNRRIEDIRNFGPYTTGILNQIGIYTEQDLLSTDYPSISQKLIEKGITPNLNIFYEIEMALQGKVWTKISSQEKQEIKQILGRK
ncbi:TfoX/Sxy family DNA transformation protein [Aquirufa ecclesiirivi]|uniref:TfoX/Sxy family DNA transformation protein n=1 Tax=Aquirufa ecclesiirivi TaxID=2715124 RepID=UPI003BAF5135